MKTRLESVTRESPSLTMTERMTEALVLCFLIAAMAQLGMAQPDVTVLEGATVIDGTGGPPRQAVIVVRGNRIQTVAPGASYPPGATVINLAGKYVLPGLWDKHLHYKDWMPEMLISNGVTSGWVQGGGAWLNAQAEGIDKGKILGPRMFLRQRSINLFEDPERARREVQEVIDLGASFIKVYTSVTPEILRVVAEEAHRAGFVVEGHLGMRARDAALAGIDGLTHATGIALDVVPPDVLERIPGFRVIDTGRRRVAFPTISSWDESNADFSFRSNVGEFGGPNPDLTEYWLFLEDPRRLMLFGLMDRNRAQSLIDLLIEEEVYIESCLGYIFRNVHDHVEEYQKEDHLFLNDPNLLYLPDIVGWNVLDYSLLEALQPDELTLMKQGYRNFQWFIRTFVQAGGKVILGPDTTSINHATMLPGVATRREMQLLVDSGLTPMQAILAGTRWPAEILGKENDLGTLASGKLADLIVLTRNPLEDITAFKEIEMVMQDGRFLRVGYHYDFANPIPWPPQNELASASWGIPTSIRSISPQVQVEGSDTFTLTVQGEGFLSTAVVRFADRFLQTELINATQLQATVPSELVRNVGSYPVRVEYRRPERGTTNPIYFIVKFK